MVRKTIVSVVTVAYLWIFGAGVTVRVEAVESSGVVRLTDDMSQEGYGSDQYWIGTGQGDLSKGRVVCQRVADLAARADLAKQIRVMVKERMIDRTRERSGKEIEQDIELT